MSDLTKLDYENRNVVVTGGTGALGSAVIRTLLAAGARCHIPCFDEDELTRFVFKDHPNVKIVSTVNLTDETETKKFYRQTPDLWASVHCTGGFWMGVALETSFRDFEQQWRLNTLSCFLCCREAVQKMRTGGRIVNVAARPGVEPQMGGGMVAYAVSKAGVVALTRSLAEELSDRQILVNAVAPSVMDTPANRESMPEAAFERWPTVEEVAATIAFLASPQNRATSGSIVPVYGRA